MVIREKFGQGISERDGRNEFGGSQSRAYGAHPGTERTPDQIRRCGGENLKQSLGDESELDVAVIGIEFAPDAITVVSRFSMGILVAAFSFDGRHGRHPEVICESSDHTQGLLEGQFDFEAQAIQFDDLQRRQIQICGQQKNRTA